MSPDHAHAGERIAPHGSDVTQNGHASSRPIHPNIPEPADLLLMHKAVADARRRRRGFWKSATPMLQALEFRWLVDSSAARMIEFKLQL